MHAQGGREGSGEIRAGPGISSPTLLKWLWSQLQSMNNLIKAFARAHVERTNSRCLDPCKACGRDVTEKMKERRPLHGKQYNALFQIATTSVLLSEAAVVHLFFGKAPSYVCKCCYSVLTKYASIAKELETIEHPVSE